MCEKERTREKEIEREKETESRATDSFPSLPTDLIVNSFYFNSLHQYVDYLEANVFKQHKQHDIHYHGSLRSRLMI